MSDKQPDLIIDPEDFHVFLKARMGTDTVAEFGAKLGVTTKLVYFLLNGTRKPSAAILKKLGLKTVFVVDRTGRTKK
jgi:hypothetical protein